MRGHTLPGMEQQAEGRRRIDHVLADDFLAGLPDLPVEDLRARRSEAEQEETDLSYARRLLHGRLDLLRAEADRRASTPDESESGRSTADLVASLSRTLADPPGPSHGLGRHGLVEPSRVGEHRRAAEAAVADPALSDPAQMPEPDLAAAIERLDDLQRTIGAQRGAVQQAADALSGELGRRYREGLLQVEDVLGHPRT